MGSTAFEHAPPNEIHQLGVRLGCLQVALTQTPAPAPAHPSIASQPLLEPVGFEDAATSRVYLITPILVDFSSSLVDPFDLIGVVSSSIPSKILHVRSTSASFCYGATWPRVFLSVVL